MITKNFTVRNKGGLHARPSGVLSHYFVTRDITAQLMYNDYFVDGDSTLDILSLCVPENEEITIILDATYDAVAEAVFADLDVLFAHGFYVDEV